LFYTKVDIPGPNPGDPPQMLAGDVISLASGGGAIADLSGDDLIIATFNDHSAPERIGCIEEFYSPVPATKALSIDLAQVSSCCDAVDAHRLAQKAEADFVFEKSIKLFGNEQSTTEGFRHVLRVQEMHTRGVAERVSDHDAIVQAQADLEALCKACEDCCERLLVTRDAAITFAEPES